MFLFLLVTNCRNCRCCNAINIIDEIGSFRFVSYESFVNVDAIFYTQPITCNRPCCSDDIHRFKARHHTPNEFRTILGRMMDSKSYDPTLYARGIIAAKKLDQKDILDQFLRDPAFDLVLTRQKYEYHAVSSIFSEEATEVWTGLKEQINTRLSRDLLGSDYQSFVLSLLSREELREILDQSRLYTPRVITEAFALLGSSSVPEPLASWRNIRELSIITSSAPRRVGIIRSGGDVRDMVAAIHRLGLRQLERYLEDYDFQHLSVPLQLKLLEDYPKEGLKELYQESTVPHVQAAVLYHMSQDIILSFSEEIQLLARNHGVLILRSDLQKIYYQFVMNNPDNELVDHLIQFLTHRDFLTKLSFIPEIRGRIQERLAFLGLI